MGRYGDIFETHLARDVFFVERWCEERGLTLLDGQRLGAAMAGQETYGGGMRPTVIIHYVSSLFSKIGFH